MGEPKERPILFSGPMVRALLAGQKTQTRRVLTMATDWSCEELAARVRCPLGQVGDRLWVRETWAAHWIHDAMRPSEAHAGLPDDNRWYLADGTDALGSHGCNPVGCRGKWRPSIHMPRWASRITLEVTSVRVERLQDISEDDALAEGVTPIGPVGCPCEGEADDPGPHVAECGWSDPNVDPVDEPHRAAFAVLWDVINGKRAPWATSPWVWVVGFKRVEVAHV